MPLSRIDLSRINLSRIDVFAGGHLVAGDNRWPCCLGRAGVSADKKEGDGATPQGSFLLRNVFYRPDRLKKPTTLLPIEEIRPTDGWCDDPHHSDYNRRVKLPHPGSCESLQRDDHLYDLFAVIGYNDDPAIAGRGSAIFLHCPGKGATRGCVALELDKLTALLASCGRETRLVIHQKSIEE